MSRGDLQVKHKKLRMGRLCLLCGNEKKRRYGSLKHVCDCPEIKATQHPPQRQPWI